MEKYVVWLCIFRLTDVFHGLSKGFYWLVPLLEVLSPNLMWVGVPVLRSCHGVLFLAFFPLEFGYEIVY